jgi:hypothetical protein
MMNIKIDNPTEIDENKLLGAFKVLVDTQKVDATLIDVVFMPSNATQIALIFSFLYNKNRHNAYIAFSCMGDFEHFMQKWGNFYDFDPTDETRISRIPSTSLIINKTAQVSLDLELVNLECRYIFRDIFPNNTLSNLEIERH